MKFKFSTKAIHGHGYSDYFGAFIPPIYFSAIFEQLIRETGEFRLSDRGFDLKYSREENPTVRILEKTFAPLEKASDCVAFNSGMAALSAALFATIKPGCRIIIPYEVYGTTLQLINDLKGFGINVVSVYPSTEDVLESINENDVIFVETITNPTLKVLDVKEIGKKAREENAVLIVDNTFASPILYNPLDDGASIVVHSATKYIAGHNDVIAGLSATKERELLENIWNWRRKLGSILQPFEAYLVLRGLKTLEIRFKRKSASAKAIAEFLKEHPKVVEVHYPGLPDDPYFHTASKLFKKKLFGGVVSFKVKGGFEEAKKVVLSTEIIKPSPSFGGTESLITQPVVSAAKFIPEECRLKAGITDNLLRLSVGLEDLEDLIEDLNRALSKI